MNMPVRNAKGRKQVFCLAFIYNFLLYIFSILCFTNELSQHFG